MRRVALSVAVLAVWVVSAPAAFAHDDVVGTSPGNGAELTAAPAEVRVRFADESRPRSGEASITGPDGASVAAGPARVRGNQLVVPMQDTATPGRYSVEFSAVATDGHPVTGTLSFTLVGPRTSTLPPTTAPPRPATNRAEDGAPWWPWLAGGAAVAALGVA
ncbi:MAG: copper resistance CopC family protein, partial [Thermocrispum sp.]